MLALGAHPGALAGGRSAAAGSRRRSAARSSARSTALVAAHASALRHRVSIARRWVLRCAVALCIAGGAPARAQVMQAGARASDAGTAVRFAIVIGNNLAISARGVLRFADDDALATHQLLVGAGVHSVLLTRLDSTSQQLHPGAVIDGLPRWADVSAVFDRLVADMRRERAAGHAVELLLFYSGHGDVDHGEGYVLLEDRHLTRTLLAELLERSPATHNHVVIDACKSYFLAFEKGPGGHRTRFSGSLAVPAELSPGRLANTGFVLSTSSDRDSHEWERFGGGVFSYEVRSALFGAADVDRDGRISYAELGAFLSTASQAVSNPRFRPDFLVRPPGGTARDLGETLLGWDAPARSAVVLDQAVGHVYVETAAGERVLDAHPAAQQELVVRVPVGRPMFVRRDDGTGGEYVVTAEGATRMSELVAHAGALGQRGAAQLAFESLFTIPFSVSSVRDYRLRWTAEPPAKQLDDDEDAGPRSSPLVARVAGVTAITAGALAVTVSGLAIARYVTGESASQADRVGINRTLRNLEIGAGVLASVAIASGAVWLTHRDRGPSRSDELSVAVLPTAGDPALGVGVTVGRAW